MKSAIVWLALGATLGVVATAISLVDGAGTSASSAALGAPSEAVARVNGEPIAREALARFAANLARERGRIELDDAERRRVLGRLVDEELLLQRGLALELERREPAVRSAIVAAVVDLLTTAESREPTRDELEHTLRENAAAFARPGRITVEAARVPLDRPSAEEALRTASRIAERARAGESLAALGRELGAPIEPPLPEGPIAPDVLRDRVGTLVIAALAKTSPGEVTAPVRAMDGYWVAKLVAREPDAAPHLEEVWEGVVQLWTQQEHAKRLEAALAELRAAARIEILDPSLRSD